MINEYYAKNFCCEDLGLIENYYKAIADMTQTWECHHRGEILPCGRFSRDDLKKFGLYYSRPASELIFMTPTAHRQLHYKGIPRPDLKGIPRSEATKKAISDAKKGVPNVKLSKKVLQFTKSGEFIREWPSATEAYRQLGISQSSICGCCNGKLKSAGGFIWEYA